VKSNERGEGTVLPDVSVTAPTMST
jgi:hypothetical protein